MDGEVLGGKGLPVASPKPKGRPWTHLVEVSKRIIHLRGKISLSANPPKIREQAITTTRHFLLPLSMAV